MFYSKIKFHSQAEGFCDLSVLNDVERRQLADCSIELRKCQRDDRIKGRRSELPASSSLAG